MNNEVKIAKALIKYLKIQQDAYDEYLRINIKALAQYTKLRDKLDN